MADDGHEDEDLFADLYDDDDVAPPSAPIATNDTSAAPNHLEAKESAPANASTDIAAPAQPSDSFSHSLGGAEADGQNDYGLQGGNYDDEAPKAIVNEHGFTGTVGIKEDGKMFIGGLNWETDEDSMRNYFSQFGEVIDCTVMRDNHTNRSRGFGFLTFKDPKAVNSVMVREHFLDGKIIDPKRAIPKEEQERTAKIFVGGVSQDCTEQEFVRFFEQFGRVIDATLMMDKETNRPRGFGFVTFEGEEPVNACLSQELRILGKQVEVKRAQPRGNVREEEEQRAGRGRGRGRGDGTPGPAGAGMAGQASAAGQSGMSPSALAAMWMQMQQMMMYQQQQQMGMNPMMQMMMMQQMQQQQQQNGGANSPNPQMMQQMQQQQQGGNGYSNNNGPQKLAAQEQQAFEQRKYEAQAARATGSATPQGQPGGYAAANNYASGFQGGNSSWDGMYDDVPQPDASGAGGATPMQPGQGINLGPGIVPPSGPAAGVGGSGFQRRGGRGGAGGGGFAPPNAPQAPAGAPTGPKNPGPRGGYGGGYRGGHRGSRHHPYNRPR